MSKTFKAAVPGILLVFLVVSLLLGRLPAVSAGPIFTIQSSLDVSWGNETLQHDVFDIRMEKIVCISIRTHH